jgi:hypothetical protein
VPLKPRDEKFAQLYALGVPALQAARAAGFNWNGSPAGNAANARKLAQRRKIRARIDWHRANRDAEALGELRHIVHDRLMAWHEVDIGDYYEKREEPFYDKDGEIVRNAEGNPVMWTVERMKAFSDLTPEQRKAIKSLTYTDKGRPNLELYSALDANRDLRKMNGLDVARAADDGDPAMRLGDKEFFAELARQAAELGVDVKMTFEVLGNEDR